MWGVGCCGCSVNIHFFRLHLRLPGIRDNTHYYYPGDNSLLALHIIVKLEQHIQDKGVNSGQPLGNFEERPWVACRVDTRFVPTLLTGQRVVAATRVLLEGCLTP